MCKINNDDDVDTISTKLCLCYPCIRVHAYTHTHITFTVTVLVLQLLLKVGFHYPSSRPEFSGRELGTWTRVVETDLYSLHSIGKLLHECELEHGGWTCQLTTVCVMVNVTHGFRCADITSSVGQLIPWINETRYLGTYVVSSTPFKCCHWVWQNAHSTEPPTP